MTRRLATVAVATIVIANVGCQPTSTSSEDLPDFLDTTHPFKVGAVLCITGPTSAHASTLDAVATLAEEYVNGSARAYSGAPEDIPCRKAKNCGAWMGTDESGNAIRGPVRIVMADDEQRDDRALDAARTLENEGVPAIIGTCSGSSTQAIFNEVTGLETVLMTPVATDNGISDLPDRTAGDIAAGLPGYVYRTVGPAYVEHRLGATVAANFPRNNEFILVRAEDETDVDCSDATSTTYCENMLGPNYHCNTPRRIAEPPKKYFTYSTDNCGGEPENYCDKLGAQSGCTTVPADASPRCSSGICCGRYRFQKVCAKIVRPKTAIVLYEDTEAGRSAVNDVRNQWLAQGNVILTARSFDPANVGNIGQTVTDLFNSAADAEQALKQQLDMNGQPILPADHWLGDSVVFLFTGAKEGALVFLEWQLRGPQLPDGTESVFWFGTDDLRSTLLLNQVPNHAIRNLYVTDPYSLGDAGAFFTDMFQTRWARKPDQYAGNVFDATLLLVAANERAGLLRERGGTLTPQPSRPSLLPNVGTDLKNSLQPVSFGCIENDLGQLIRPLCPDAPNPGDIVQRAAQDFPLALQALQNGKEVAIGGVTGILTLSPAGDRLAIIGIWKVASAGPTLGFFLASRSDPFATGVFWEK